jgi:hypothetical protein
LEFSLDWISRVFGLRGEVRRNWFGGVLVRLNFLYRWRFEFEECSEVTEKVDVGVQTDEEEARVDRMEDEGEAENEEAEKDPGEEVMTDGVMVAVYDMDLDVKEEV